MEKNKITYDLLTILPQRWVQVNLQNLLSSIPVCHSRNDTILDKEAWWEAEAALAAHIWIVCPTSLVWIYGLNLGVSCRTTASQITSDFITLYRSHTSEEKRQTYTSILHLNRLFDQRIKERASRPPLPVVSTLRLSRPQEADCIIQYFLYILYFLSFAHHCIITGVFANHKAINTQNTLPGCGFTSRGGQLRGRYTAKLTCPRLGVYQGRRTKANGYKRWMNGEWATPLCFWSTAWKSSLPHTHTHWPTEKGSDKMEHIWSCQEHSLTSLPVNPWRETTEFDGNNCRWKNQESQSKYLPVCTTVDQHACVVVLMAQEDAAYRLYHFVKFKY